MVPPSGSGRESATSSLDSPSRAKQPNSESWATLEFQQIMTTVAFTEQTVADLSRSIAWYRDGLGFEVTLLDEVNQFALLGNLALKQGLPNPGTTLVHVQVPNLTDTLAHLATLDIRPVGEFKTSSEGYTRARLTDPDGHGIVLFQLDASATLSFQ
jgi:catechol 2,3-dioxygenase-like lactoylglutathione lyase family enzyme